MTAMTSTSGRLHSELSEFYSSRLIRKLTTSLKFQEFCHHNQIMDSSTTHVWLFLLCSNLGLEIFSPRMYLNLVFVFRCSSSTTNPVSVRRVDSSFLVFSLSSHRYSFLSLLFSSRFIDSKFTSLTVVTSGCIYDEFSRLLFLQAHRET